MSQIQDKRVVFLVGCARSGTTWLQMLLSGHPAVATGRETHVFDWYVGALMDAFEADARQPSDDGLHALLGREQFLSLVRHFPDACFARFLEANPEATVLLEKTPGHLFQAERILGLYPGAVFIHLVRDPRAVAASMLAASRTNWGAWAPDNVLSAARTWKDATEAADKLSRTAADYTELRYEDLIGDTAGALGRVLEFLKLPLDRDEIERICTQNQIDAVRRETAERDRDSGQPSLGRESRAEFFRRGLPDGWTQELSRSEIAIVEHVNRSGMHRYGYERYIPDLYGRWAFAVARTQGRFGKWRRSLSRRISAAR